MRELYCSGKQPAGGWTMAVPVTSFKPAKFPENAKSKASLSHPSEFQNDGESCAKKLHPNNLRFPIERDGFGAIVLRLETPLESEVKGRETICEVNTWRRYPVIRAMLLIGPFWLAG
jgi:hypothetical protein